MTTLLCMLWARDPRGQGPKKSAVQDPGPGAIGATRANSIGNTIGNTIGNSIGNTIVKINVNIMD